MMSFEYHMALNKRSGLCGIVNKSSSSYIGSLRNSVVELVGRRARYSELSRLTRAEYAQKYVYGWFQELRNGYRAIFEQIDGKLGRT